MQTTLPGLAINPSSILFTPKQLQKVETEANGTDQMSVNFYKHPSSVAWPTIIGRTKTGVSSYDSA